MKVFFVLLSSWYLFQIILLSNHTQFLLFLKFQLQCACMCIAQLCLTLCNPMDPSLPGFSRGSSWPRDWNRVSHIAVRPYCLNQIGLMTYYYGNLFFPLIRRKRHSLVKIYSYSKEINFTYPKGKRLISNLSFTFQIGTVLKEKMSLLIIKWIHVA